MSSFEHGGRWKLANYFARKFFQPVLLSVDEHVRGQLQVFLVNDLPGTSVLGKILISVRRYDQVDHTCGGNVNLGEVEVGEKSAKLVKTAVVSLEIYPCNIWKKSVNYRFLFAVLSRLTTFCPSAISLTSRRILRTSLICRMTTACRTRT